MNVFATVNGKIFKLLRISYTEPKFDDRVVHFTQPLQLSIVEKFCYLATVLSLTGHFGSFRVIKLVVICLCR